MDSVTLYRLHPSGAFHLGERGVGLEETTEGYPSDSLFSSLCAALRDLDGSTAVDEFLAGFQDESPPVVISSCFPWAGDVLLFPRPYWPPPVSPPPERGKEARRLRYVSLGLLRAYLRMDTAPPSWDDTVALQGGRVRCTAAETAGLPPTATSSIWEVHKAPRVTLDRVTSASEIYHCGRLWFSRGCGLYFLAWWHRDRQRYQPLVERALDRLAESGIGGERSSGHGAFSWTAEDAPLADLPVARAGALALTLSLYLPTPAELQAGALAPPASYDLRQRFGWMSSPDARNLRRKTVHMLADGSVINAPGPVAGSLADVTPDVPLPHRVYRSGLAFLVGGLAPEVVP